MKRHTSYLFVLFNFLLTLAYVQDSDAKTIKLLQALKSQEHIILLRHSIAPGFGDPKNFDISNCKTQRNLSKKGIDQAQKIGVFLRQVGYKKVTIYSSEWCRCKDTAKALSLGKYKTLNLLNSFFSNISNGYQQTLTLEKWIKKLPMNEPTILVTHQVNITALTGYSPSQGEIILLKKLKAGKTKIIGTIVADKLKSLI